MEDFEVKSAVDFVGNYYNGIHVSKFSHFSVQPSGKKKAMFSCTCHCGNVFTSLKDNIVKGKAKSCGCNKGSNASKSNLELLLRKYLNKTMGHLTIVSLNKRIVKSNHSTNISWNCICVCGKEVIRSQEALLSNGLISCGCMGRNTSSHGKSYTITYKSWQAMKERCTNTKNKDYSGYGGRGIVVCQRWLESFENFYTDMGERPTGLTLDRIDVNGNYEPSNCRWASSALQSFNRRNSKNKSGVVGVRLSENKYNVTIGKKYIGAFDSIEEATSKRRQAELDYYGFNLNGGNFK